MEIKGQIIDIIYQNEINSYTVAEFETNEEIITIVGYLPFVENGDSLKLQGNFIEHQDYGRQFKIETFEKIMPEGIEALERYLAGGIIKGIGPATAKKIIDKFGEETIGILRFTPEKLSIIKGITREKARLISEEFNEKWELWQIVGFLERFGISPQNCKKIYEILGKDAIEKIEKDPYILLDITYGVDFTKIDKMAIDLGIAINDAKRIESAIKYSLVLSNNNGNTCTIKENLIEFVKNLIGVDKEDIEEAMINLIARKEIILEKRENNWIYLDVFYKCEENISKKIIALRDTKNIKKIKGFETKFKETEKKEDIKLSEKQKEAIKLINDNNVCVITGGPGTGKTTIIKFIIDMYKNEKKKVVLCAPTGRAAKRMTEATGEDASTIHRLLEIGKQEEILSMERVDYPIKPIDADVIIVDEMSMVDVFVMNYILKGIYLGTKLVLVGDANQLPSVGPGNILKDIIESEVIPVIELNEIFRQAARSKIVTNAHRVNNGEMFDFESDEDEECDFYYINDISQDKALKDIISLCNGRLKAYGDYDFISDIQVITPTKKGKLGTKELNKALQQALNTEKVEEKVHGERVFKEGDRVMQIKNNYDIYWEKEGEAGSGIFNGEIGIISAVDNELKQIEILFDDDKTAWYDYQDLDQIEHSYAITIHKSQRK